MLKAAADVDLLHSAPTRRWRSVDDVSSAVLWLASYGARYVTGTTVSVDAGFCLKLRRRDPRVVRGGGRERGSVLRPDGRALAGRAPRLKTYQLS